ncbi:MAG: AdeC/AdeK/OprM family multidrug efflux complex outer membrane factor [Nitrospirae bacterium]|nr:AdeC/AdeK/OprM family multidrug efflux complex outer membrane factor [Nitrospirota bacterium]
MKRMGISLSIAIAAMLTLAGCFSLAPNYSRPDAPVPEAWPSGEAYKNEPTKQPGNLAADVSWKNFFTDERLIKVIYLALNNNRDLKIAALNIEKMRSQYQIQRADLLPSVNATASGTAQEIPRPLSNKGQSITTHQYGISLGFSSYELDLFGRIRSLKDRALEEFLATEEAHRSIHISLIAEVANSYMTLAADKERLKIAKDTLENRQASYNLIKRRFEAGASSELDLRQGQTAVDSARVDVARFKSLAAQDENALALVVGSYLPPELLPSGLSQIAEFKELSAGLPSEVLQRRPDIMQAEHLLKASNANIGAARAAFFPRIALTTSIGLASDQLSTLFNGINEAWSFAPQITMPIFDSGRIRANARVTEIDRQIFLSRYEKAIQTAFREVADALAQRGTLGDQLAAQQSLVESSAASYRLSDVRYKNGIDSYLTVLDSQRSLYNAQQGLIAIRLSGITNLVTLYKALGGGTEK